ncbi:MAG: GNAT family N-acetyltransferase [Pseudomonadota bacterium]
MTVLPEGVAIRATTLPPAPADRAFLEHGMAALQEFERAVEPNRLPGAEMAGAHVSALLAAAMEGGGGALVAEDRAGPCGLLVYLVEHAFGRFVLPENQRYGYISDLWVDPRIRGRGVASALIARAGRDLADLGCRRIEISAITANSRAIRLYEALGFSPDHVTLARTLPGPDAP